jgi:hypothetical protein
MRTTGGEEEEAIAKEKAEAIQRARQKHVSDGKE